MLSSSELRIMFDWHGPAECSIEAPLTALADLQRRGLLQYIGLSNATAAQIQERRRICPVVCVQNHFNLVHRDDDALIDTLAREGIASVPFFPLGGLTPPQSDALSEVVDSLDATPMQVALAWLLQRAPNIPLIPKNLLASTPEGESRGGGSCPASAGDCGTGGDERWAKCRWGELDR